MFVIYFVALVCILYSYYYLKRRRFVSLGNAFPGPKALPLIGNALSFVNKPPEEMFNNLYSYFKQYGKTYRLWFGPDLWIIVTNPKQIEEILTNQTINKSVDYKYLIPWLGDGLLLSNGKKWFQRRKIITPAFHFNILEEFVEIFESQSNTMISLLKKHDKKETIDLVPYLELCTLDIICETAMGTTINAQLNKNSAYMNAVHKAALIIYIRIFDTFAQNDFCFSLTKNAKHFKDSMKILHDFTDDVIIKRRNEILELNDKNQSSLIVTEDDIPKKRKALLDILLQSSIEGKPLTNEDIRDEVNTFMFAGHDTTSSGIGFLLYNIAKYTDIQEKILQEISDVIGLNKENKITYRHLVDMKYLELVIKESLRLFPSAPYVGRQFKEETTIDGVTYPANSNISIAVFLMHRDPNLYSDPEKFMPERFEAERISEKSNPFSYIPFSGGSRNCIGQKFAMFEMKVLAINILRNFKIKLADENEKICLLSKLTLKSKNGIRLTLEQR